MVISSVPALYSLGAQARPPWFSVLVSSPGRLGFSEALAPTEEG